MRHPLMLGFPLASWAAPAMTYGDLLFAAPVTAYVFVALRREKCDLEPKMESLTLLTRRESGCSCRFP